MQFPIVETLTPEYHQAGLRDQPQKACLIVGRTRLECDTTDL
ncbi:hypothetical protein BSIN_2018 [Burkholderia singularis]|uniref:Uncharacterized protein n=1 Tax=Burkholderia singularis TaxID=1503053 RepID=A0A238H0M5_9BURK|nr:hypothetical protein BSIN_2018 [Burkholderia singularis]